MIAVVQCGAAIPFITRFQLISMQLPLLAQIIFACLLGGVLSVFAAAAVMVGLPRRFLPMAVSFSAGLLLSTALLHLLPEAMEGGLTPHEVFPLLLSCS